ncbi:hypothetical protein D3C71_2044910 [compost metagenome]
MVAHVQRLRDDARAQGAATVGQLLQPLGVPALQNQGFRTGRGVLQRQRATDAAGCASDEDAA